MIVRILWKEFQMISSITSIHPLPILQSSHLKIKDHLKKGGKKPKMKRKISLRISVKPLLFSLKRIRNCSNHFSMNMGFRIGRSARNYSKRRNPSTPSRNSGKFGQTTNTRNALEWSVVCFSGSMPTPTSSTPGSKVICVT